ncbi:autophagy-related protein 2 homolog B-like [Mya arenaria]|uniref:autophagy-related protein 2 homolog B-like n=1 Tax=Mya arenaria TaxID=6604 RepID=UPI0022E5AEDA|nr:autophagy-related protein 2 homolog B-like [Mya arenaria]
MPWNFGNLGGMQDFLKKKACRYLLQHYLGQFLKQKLSLDQLSLDLYNGQGKITDLNLDVQAINEDLGSLAVPVELVDGFVECIAVSIPWSSLINDNTCLEVTGLELTLQPKQREDNGMMAGDMLSSMHSSMTTSLQLARECLESDSGTSQQPQQPIEGVQKFALMIDSVLSKIRVKLLNTVIRLEHQPGGTVQGTALEIRIKRIEYFDDMATTSEGSSVDSNTTHEPAAMALKNLHIEGIQLFYDETGERKSPARSPTSSDGSPPQMFQSAMTSLASGASVYKSTIQSPNQSNLHKSTQSGLGTTPLSEPVHLATITGRQEIKVKIKQRDNISGPKLEIMCQFGGIHVLVCPRQLHGITQLLSALNTSDNSTGLRQGASSRPMDVVDQARVERELQYQLQSGRVTSNNLASLQEYSLHGEDDDQFQSMMGRCQGPGSDMDSSFTSNYSTSSARTTSTAFSGTSQPKSGGKSSKDGMAGGARYHEDPNADLSHYHVRVGFISLTLLHTTPGPPTDQPALDGMKEVATTFFQRVAGVTAAGMSDLKEIREQMTALLHFDHLRLLGRPLTVECTQKSALRQVSTSVHVSLGVAEVVETLYGPRDQKPAHQHSEILVFKRDSAEAGRGGMYSSMHSGVPCVSLNITTHSSNKRNSRVGSLPQMDVRLELGELEMELDVTLVDRIHGLLNPDTGPTPSHMKPGMSMYHTVGQQFYSISETLNEGTSSTDQHVIVEVTSPCAAVNVRFPIPDLRKEPHVNKSWYKRTLRDDVLTLKLKDALVRTSYVTSQELEEIHVSCGEVDGYLKYQPNDEGIHFAHVMGEGEGFNNPMVTVRFCNTTHSVLNDENMYPDDTTPADSLNGACAFAKAEPSAFSSKRNMHDTTPGTGATSDRTEQMVLPSDREEVQEFIERSVNNTQMEVKINLPNACLFIPDKHFFEVLYNRLNNDMLLWEPSAPAPVMVPHDTYCTAGRLDVYNQLLHVDHFEMAKSGLQMDSDSDSDSESINHYSIHDRGLSRKPKSPRQQQSKLCISLSIKHGRLTGYTGSPGSDGKAREGVHGEVLVQLSDFLLFTVSAHNGDPGLTFLNILGNRVDIYHNGSVSESGRGPDPPVVNISELGKPVPEQLQANKVIYLSETGVLVNTREPVGSGQGSLDMLNVALRIKLDTHTTKHDLISDETVKEFQVSVGLRGATMRHKMLQPYQSIFTQLLQFLDVKDYPILGYVDPKVLTELHVHLWTCAIDYRPEYLPLRSVILAESFSISSNIVAESAISLLRFVLEEGSLFIGSHVRKSNVDLRHDYVCVADISRLEILLRSNTGNNPHFPKTDLSVSSNLVNIRTCADSLTAIINLLQYVAGDGDLHPPQGADLGTPDSQPDPPSLSKEESDVEDSEPLTSSSVDHLHCLMSEAMAESSDSNQSSGHVSPEVSQIARKKTEVFFVHTNGAAESPVSLDPIVITQNIDSVSSSTMSGHVSDDDGSDDFCMVEDAAWGKATNDSEPLIRVLTEEPIEIKDEFFKRPVGRTDFLKSPETFPLPEIRYTIKEVTLIWHIYGGSDLTQTDGSEDRVSTSRDSMTVSYQRGSPVDLWSGRAGGREAPLIQRETLHTRGGPSRNTGMCMEFQLTKVRLQHEVYPTHTEAASRQVLLISDLEIRDKLSTSRMNKFLYQYSSNDMPKQTYANMVHIRAIHTRPNPQQTEEECALKVSLQPLRLNIDQDTLFFLKRFFTELSGGDAGVTSPGSAPPPDQETPRAPPPVITVNKPLPPEAIKDQQDLLMQFDEFTQDLQASLRGSLSSSGQSAMKSSVSSSDTITSDTVHTSQPVFFKSFVFSPDVPIMLDYQGKFDSEHGTLAGLGGLVSLNKAELKLKRLSYKQGLLGSDRVLMYCGNEWLTDIRLNQLPTILGGFGPVHAFVQLAYGVKDLFWLPVEQYRRDGRIMRGIQRGASSFSMSTAMSVLELTNRLVQGIQWCAELTFDMVSPGPRRRGYYPRQPADLREGVSNAYIVLREGFSESASNMASAAQQDESRGVMRTVGHVLRQIPPTMVQPLITVPEAASNVIAGLKSQLKPDARKEDEDKWKEEIID